MHLPVLLFFLFPVQQIEVGDVIGEIETDKATLEFESLEEGYTKLPIVLFV